jgi:GT2 family glycosyltransferase
MNPDRPDTSLPEGLGGEAAEWHRVAEARRLQLERLQQQRLYVVAARALAMARRAAGRIERTLDPVRAGGSRLVRSCVAIPTRIRAGARERALRDAVAALPAPSRGSAPTPVSQLVTAVIVTAAQPERLDALLTALGRLEVRAIVVDNAGVVDIEDVVARHAMAERQRLVVPATFAAANEHAMPHVRTPWTLFVNDDVLPLDDSWLARMLAAGTQGVVAVGAHLIHGRRGWLGGAAVDLTVQHAGIGLAVEGPDVRAEHLERGMQPRPRVEHPVVVAATAACLLVRTDAHREVGGFHLGFDYGMEDVDLCLRLGAHGDLRVALDAVLLHEEGATRLVDRRGGDRRVRTRRQAANRELLAARHGAALRRRLLDGSLAAARPAVVVVEGPVPSELVDASPWDLVDVSGPRARSAALRLLTGPRALPSAARTDEVDDGIPVVAWGDAVGTVALAEPSRFDRVDALVVTDAVLAAQVRAAAPTLPVHVVAAGDVAHGAETLRAIGTAPRWSLRIGAPSGRGGARWGDVPVADALRRELRAHGLVVRIAGRDVWGSGADAGADVTLHLKGRGVAPVAPVQCNLLWVFSHPSEIAPGELDAADMVLAASALLARRLREMTSTPVVEMPQAADARRFSVGPVEESLRSRLLFVGNTRSIARPVVMHCVAAGLPLTLVGAGWERFVDPKLVTQDLVPPDRLPAWFRAADVVLNDHWDDMRRWGIVSNRVFDALACGACVLSDEVPGMAALLDDAVATFDDAQTFVERAAALLDDPEDRAARAERGRRAVLAAHTWEHRATQLVDLVSGHDSHHGVEHPEPRP